MFLIKTRDEEIASFIGTLLKKDDDTFKKRLISDERILKKIYYFVTKILD